ncbi:hypothetical protein [Sorangium cellulosum]|uniref:hypothetical protein n=1 Tax=Sorangium cellulosum TaxID=56 RepID=UPI001F2B1431|nr:hypothetical protein [Sorangium cellulosum]
MLGTTAMVSCEGESAEELAAFEIDELAGRDGRRAVSSAAGLRVRFARGVGELPGDSLVFVLDEEAILRWRPSAKQPDGVLSRLDLVTLGASIAVEHGGIWEEGIVLGRVVRQVSAGGWKVDGDVERYGSVAEAEEAHGPLEVGEPREEPAWAGASMFELGEPIGRDARGVARRARRDT